MITEGFNLFEFLERKFSQVSPKYQPNPKNRIQHYRRPGRFLMKKTREKATKFSVLKFKTISAPRWPRPQLQYNYDTPQDNIVDEQPIPVEAPPQPPRYISILSSIELNLKPQRMTKIISQILLKVIFVNF